MDITIVYAISLAALFAAYVIYKLNQAIDVYRYCRSRLRKFVLYPLVMQRFQGSHNSNIGECLILSLYFGANMFCMLFRLEKPRLADRAGALFLINLIPLYIGQRSSILTDWLVPADVIGLSAIHHWMGRICTLHAVVHGVAHFLVSVKTPGLAVNIVVRYFKPMQRIKTTYGNSYFAAS